MDRKTLAERLSKGVLHIPRIEEPEPMNGLLHAQREFRHRDPEPRPGKLPALFSWLAAVLSIILVVGAVLLAYVIWRAM